MFYTTFFIMVVYLQVVKEYEGIFVIVFDGIFVVVAPPLPPSSARSPPPPSPPPVCNLISDSSFS
jgi:hypothetical protein